MRPSRMRPSRLFAILAASVLFAGALPDLAQSEPPENPDLQNLVKELKAAIQTAQDKKTADAAFLRELREVVGRYDVAELVELLFDDFRDGNYTANPAWVVDSGSFRVAQGFGLRTQFTPVVPASQGTQGTAQGEGQTLGRALLGTVLNELQQQQQGVAQAIAPTRAEIHTQLGISNAFTLKLQLQTSVQEGGEGQLELGPYQGSQRDTGYRLVYHAGQTPTLELQRLTAGRSAVVETTNKVGQLGDNRTRNLEWQRHGDGSMVVSLDGEVLIQTTDRATQGAFDGFTFVNLGGDYSLRQIEILGTRQ